MPRLALTVVLTSMTWLAVAAGASACITEHPGASGEGAEPSAPVHPGDSMTFSFSGLDEGAEYQFFVGGRAVSPSTKTARTVPVSGSFELEDYGPSARALEVSVHVLHEGAGTSHVESLDHNFVGPDLRYVPRAVGTQPPASRPA